MLIFPLGVGAKGPTISSDTICQGRPACNRCLLWLITGLLCFAAWQTSHELTIRLVSAVSPGQNHSFWTLLVVLSMPIWPWRWISYTAGSLSGLGQTTVHLSVSGSCPRILSNPACTSIRGNRRIRRGSSASLSSMILGSGATPDIRASLAMDEFGVSWSCSNSARETCEVSEMAPTCGGAF